LGVQELVEAHDRWRLKECLNLIPSENVTSLVVRSILASDLGHRYSLRPEEAPDFPTPGDNFYCGTRYADEIERLGEELAKRLFGCKHAFLQPLSGHVAAFIMLASLTSRGDTVMCISERDGGYPGYEPVGLPSYLGLKVAYLPFDRAECDLAYEACEEAVRRARPRLVILGASTILFPYDLRRVREFCDEVGAFLGYDGSHVLGLIAGRQFQPDPFKAGVDMLVGSTHKTFFGPQGGLVLTDDDELAERVRHHLKLKTLDNPHLNRVAALARALEEMSEHGEAYARQVVANARALAKALDELGLPVLYGHKGYTTSHQVLLDTAQLERELGRPYWRLASLLEEANIIVDRAGRLGTQELTRWGMGEDAMREVAELLAGVLRGRLAPEEARRKVLSLRERYAELRFC